MGSCIDLRKYQDPSNIEDAFAQLVSGGKAGYKTVIEKKKVPSRCSGCGRGGDPEQKFCSQCGGKMIIPILNCPKCTKPVDDGEKFCTECGTSFKLSQQ
ncbi:MAG: zinc ribbon domain-containing protein [Nanoarchaeota archaeon]